MRTNKNSDLFSLESFFSFILPLALGFLFALLWYPPNAKGLVGWGDDPYFNLWTLEEVWKHLTSMGPWNIFTDAFWSTPIFAPFPNTLALSENQIIPAFLSWPIRALSHNGIYTYNLLAMLMSIATFFFTWRWLSSIGIKKYACWGSLLFQACGWIQDQYAHFQNICIFVFPLALYSWNCLIKKPTYIRALLCAFSFGWVVGWNVYYQVFLNFIFGVLLTKAFFKNEIKKPLIAFLGLATLGFELPLAIKYLELERLMGSLATTSTEIASYSALPLSFLAHADTTSFLQRFLPLYPNIQLPIESVGFLGLIWTALTFFALKDSRSRIFSLIALFFFWVALGPHFGLMSLLKLYPGFHGTRAIGRIQVLTALFSLAGILHFLETLKPRLQHILLGLMLIELIPGGLSKHVLINSGSFDFIAAQPTELELQLSQIPQTDALLTLPGLSGELQLSLSRTKISLIDGYTGRTPLNVQILNQLGKNGLTSDTLKQKLFFSKAKYLISTEESLSQELKQFPFLIQQGCYPHFERRPCLFRPKWSLSDDLKRLNQTALYLDQDTHWEYSRANGLQNAVLIADRSGVLAFDVTGKCWLETTILLGDLRIWQNKRALWGHEFKVAELVKGEEIFRQKFKDWTLYLPEIIRPRKIFSLACKHSAR